MLKLESDLFKCLKNQPFDVIKMREFRGEFEKKTKKEMDIHLFL